MEDIFDLDKSAHFSAISQIIERIEDIGEDNTLASKKEANLLNQFYNEINKRSSSSKKKKKTIKKKTANKKKKCGPTRTPKKKC